MMMNEYIINANSIFIELRDNIETFNKEAKIIDEAKCYLANYQNLDNFEYDGAIVNDIGNGYEIIYDDLIIELETKDRIIIDYRIS